MMTPPAEQSALDPNSGDQRRGVMMNAMTTECLNVMEQGARDLLQLAGIVDAALVQRVSEYLGPCLSGCHPSERARWHSKHCARPSGLFCVTRRIRRAPRRSSCAASASVDLVG